MSNISLPTTDHIENRIFSIRGEYVMLDSDLAYIYGVPTSRLNEQVKRNIERFPEDFMFQLSKEEWDNLISQNATSSAHGGRRKIPFVFTEQGVAGLSGVLKSEQASQVHVTIMRAFVSMRKLIASQHGLIQRIDGLERKHLETEQKFEKVFKALEQNTIPTQGIFFDGQVFDAYELTSRIIRSAKKSIVLIDNYIDESTFTHLSKKESGVMVTLFSNSNSKQLQLDLKKANEQYGGFEIRPFSKSHDRFLIIDSNEVYHLGASLKDLGKKWFAFSKLDKLFVDRILHLQSMISK
ncbi:MAG: ORF6N domain-containing protein [Flavobacteriales bacterium]|nr:ORF6N domain-containing protein [Flavobacteriales bacterium]